MAQKPSIPKGTRDFSPAETARRNYIFDTCREVFRTFGYAPIETPAMENLSTLLGKYGDEGDKLLFKVLNSGDFMKGIKIPQAGEQVHVKMDGRPNPKSGFDFEFVEDVLNSSIPGDTTKDILPFISEKGLRYDLTVPFARYVVQHQNDIAFPFKRSQIQPVWRADRPQKGRYREFYQCDVDMIGSRSLTNEVELIQIVEAVFARLGVAVTLKLNNRKILAGIAEVMGHPDRLIDITVALDKLEKIGLEAVKAELSDRGLPAAAIAKLSPILALSGTNGEKLRRLAEIFGGSSGVPEARESSGPLDSNGDSEANTAPHYETNLQAGSETGLLGIEEMSYIFAMINELQVPIEVELDLSLARGLNYYTGTIFEVKALDFAIGSICGGGRYDDLTGIFGMPGVSGVGISFGADRIYDVMEGLGLFPEQATGGTQVLFLNLGGNEAIASMKLLAELRRKGIAAEIYPDAGKMKKQMEWANRRAIPQVVIVGEEELAKGVATIKNMNSGEQQQVDLERFANMF